MRLLALVAALLFAAGSAIACPMHTAGHGQTVAQKPPAQSPGDRASHASTPARTWSRIPASVASSGSTAWVADDVHAACGARAPSRSPPSAANRSPART